MSEETKKQEGTSPLTVPFRRKYLDEEKETTGREVLSLKINQEERLMIDRLKRCFNTSQDGRILKQALRTFEKVVLSHFTASEMQYWTSTERRKPLFENTTNEVSDAKK